ncbi:MAG: histidine kinase [Clostridia bacterium]|nr:histidine kinase [Clostridia bacterium]
MRIKRFYNNMSILHKMIFLYIVIIIICISILTGINSYHSTKVIREIAKSSVSQVMNSTYRSMTAQINNVNYIFTTLQANKMLQNALNDTDTSHVAYNVGIIDNILFETDVYKQKISSIELYALNHPEYLSCNTERVMSDKLIRNTVIYNKILSGGTVPIWIANDNNYASKSSITAMKLLTDSFTEQPIAIIRIDIDTSQFVSLFQNLRLADTGQIFLCTSPLHIINPYDNTLIASFMHNTELNTLISQNCSGTAYTTVNNEDYMLSSYPLENTDFYLVGAARLVEFNTKSSSIRKAAIYTAAAMILIILFLLSYVSAYISRPLINLSKELDNFSPDTVQEVQYNQNDEIGRLYRSFNNMQERISKLTHELSYSLKIQKKAELKAIQSQISPHFLYNTLNSISALAQKHNINEIEYMTTSLATFFTRTLNGGNTFCTIRDELTHIQSYVNIQNIRFSNKFNIIFNIPDEIMDYSIINLTLQPLVENCIVHAFKNKSGKGNIIISGRREKTDLYIDVSDDGLGANITDVNYLNNYVNRSFNFDEQIEQYGIHNVNHRIKLYYGSEYGLLYSYNENGGITATVHICTEKKEGNN